MKSFLQAPGFIYCSSSIDSLAAKTQMGSKTDGKGVYLKRYRIKEHEGIAVVPVKGIMRLSRQKVQ